MLTSLAFPASGSLPNDRHRGLPSVAPRSLFSRSLIPIRKGCRSVKAASPERSLEASWIPAEGNAGDVYGGWAVCKAQMDDRKDHLKFVLAGVGTSVAILLAVLTYRSASRKGYQFYIGVPLHAVLPRFRSDESTNAECTAPGVDQVSETKLDGEPVASDTSGLDENSASVMQERKIKIIHVAADSTQREALFVLKKLKIIDDDVNPDELCTRREYARWLVRANTLLERRPRHKIVALRPMTFTGLVGTAFDDVSVNDPDFWCIQALGEAGIVHSKLAPMDFAQSDIHSSYDLQGRFNFSPESFISRLDLVNWKVLLEYPFQYNTEAKMLRTKAGFLDLSVISLDTSPQLLTDLMAGDNSITRRTFGNTRRLQPHKPATKAQAAVALASGRMAEVIHTELSRLEAEKVSRLAEMEEIRSEFIERGEIPRFWEEKLNKEKERVLEAEKNFHAALHDLEIEKKALDEDLAEYMKEKAALDSQCQSLVRLREEVDGIRDKLSTERTSYIVEKESLEKQLTDLLENLEAISERKSKLEAEKEATQILRSWVEEEAQRIQARAKFLAEAARRWNWNNSIESQDAIYNKRNNPESSS
ncbi:uncharacterized protein LOC120280823 [Dioscorea cayenensis subsp. rotundata]|uniref:Uncharacterized protein LOC120280823 n=1 Tax=Dioscorea cayennensis subsp. rotundata TaxID=55577 RepID=A0AB40CUG7_DIOCR|nr:uncharacterized protein LOC120280823 [Dioscorea cayenensis subsp. rotundata]